MRIRRHLFLYNTISVLVALVAMLAVNGAATHGIGRHYQRQAEEMFHALPADRLPAEGTLWVERDSGRLELVGTVPQVHPKEAGPRRPQSEVLMLSLLLSGDRKSVV